MKMVEWAQSFKWRASLRTNHEKQSWKRHFNYYDGALLGHQYASDFRSTQHGGFCLDSDVLGANVLHYLPQSMQIELARLCSKWQQADLR